MTQQELTILVEGGASLETVHQLHGDLVMCPLDEVELNVKRNDWFKGKWEGRHE